MGKGRMSIHPTRIRWKQPLIWGVKAIEQAGNTYLPAMRMP